MHSFFYLRTYEGREKRTLTLQRQQVQEPLKAEIGKKQLFMYRVPFSREYLDKLQKSFWMRKLFFVWIHVCFCGRCNKWIVKLMCDKLSEGRLLELCDIPQELSEDYCLLYLQNEHVWDQSAAWGILCSTAFDGLSVVRFIEQAGANVSEIILYFEAGTGVFGSRTGDGAFSAGTGLLASFRDFEAGTGVMVTKTSDISVFSTCKVILDGGGMDNKQIRYLRDGCTYIDLTNDRMKQRRITRKSPQIQYISLGKFLDRLFEISL